MVFSAYRYLGFRRARYFRYDDCAENAFLFGDIKGIEGIAQAWTYRDDPSLSDIRPIIDQLDSPIGREAIALTASKEVERVRSRLRKNLEKPGGYEEKIKADQQTLERLTSVIRKLRIQVTAHDISTH